MLSLVTLLGIHGYQCSKQTKTVENSILVAIRKLIIMYI